MQGGCVCENCSLLRVNTGNVEIAGAVRPQADGMSAANDWTKEMMTKGFPELKQLYDLYGAKDKVAVQAWLEYGHQYNVHVAADDVLVVPQAPAGKDEEVKEAAVQAGRRRRNFASTTPSTRGRRTNSTRQKLREVMTKARDDADGEARPEGRGEPEGVPARRRHGAAGDGEQRVAEGDRDSRGRPVNSSDGRPTGAGPRSATRTRRTRCRAVASDRPEGEGRNARSSGCTRRASRVWSRTASRPGGEGADRRRVRGRRTGPARHRRATRSRSRSRWTRASPATPTATTARCWPTAFTTR